jgi:Ca2+-binding RTX toxin-like protein
VRGGNDRLRGALGNDILNGGPRGDIALYSGPTAVSVSLNMDFATGLGRDVLIATESVRGSTANDRLIGSGATNFLVGDGGADTIFGLGGPDILNSRDGIQGNDAVNGGPGMDRCITDPTENAITGCP